MAVGFYDHDIILKPNRLLLNLELMKIANYYHRQNKSVVLMKDLSEIDNFEKVFIFRNLPEKNVPASIKRKVATDIIFLPQKNVEHFGLVYSGEKYVPMNLEFEKEKAFVQIYANYLKEQINNKKLTLHQVQKLVDSHYLRLRAGDYEISLDNLARKSKLFIYDREIEEVSDWENKLLYARKNLMPTNPKLRVQIPNGFKITSFESVQKLLAIDGINAVDLWLYTKNSYPSFRTEFTKIAPYVSSRDGMKYIFGRDINPHSNNEVMKEFCLTMNKFFLTKSLLKTCEFIVDDECMVSPIYRMLKDFQYFTSLRVGNTTLKEYFIKRSKVAFNETYNIIGKTAYKDQFESLVNISTNRVKEVGWYYRV